MTKKTRLTILLVCVACFLVIAPILVLYSMGYRFDFEKMKMTETGGIYVRTFPAAGQIIIDSKISEKPGLFANSIFVQSLLPNNHTVLIEKTGYYDYSKILPVQEKEVTKIENVFLFKKNIQFAIITDKSQSPFNVTEKFIIKKNNLYYSSAPENSALTALRKSTPILKNVVAFAMQGNNIIWLGTGGLLYKSDSTNFLATPIKITLTAIKISKTSSYKIIINRQNIFLIANGQLLFLNAKTNELDIFSTSANGAEISPDGQNIIYYTDANIYFSPILNAPAQPNILYKSPTKITSCLWLNNYYIIFTAGLPGQGDKIIISETDYRDNINTVTLPQIIVISPTEKIDIKKPQIFFNQQEGKLYILTGSTLLLSEKITP